MFCSREGLQHIVALIKQSCPSFGTLWTEKRGLKNSVNSRPLSVINKQLLVYITLHSSSSVIDRHITDQVVAISTTARFVKVSFCHTESTTARVYL